ncbi:MAG TPA: formamidopyrimidine-DNA glycosylase [Planctomycetes bacterium]|nr:formamidopyrimidine-DNA glycosylase [Planctomycetota bacterium]
MKHADGEEPPARVVDLAVILKDFVNSDGKPGYFRQKLLVYGREGQECLECKAEIAHVVIGQRASCYCPKCQK